MRHSTYLPLAGVLIGLAVGAQPAAAADPLCHTMHAVQSSNLDIAGQEVVWTATARPGCEGATITIAAHRTAYTAWNDAEVQPLAGSVSAHLADVPVVVRFELPALVEPGACNWQVDAVVGGPFEQVDSSHRYNEFSIGGSRNRLVEARYVAGECVAAPTTTEVAEPLPPAAVEPPVATVPEPGVEGSSQRVERVTPTTTVVVSAPPVQGQRLPETGGRVLWTFLVGFVALLAGAVVLLVSRWRERRRAVLAMRDLPPGRGWAGLVDDLGRVG